MVFKWNILTVRTFTHCQNDKQSVGGGAVHRWLCQRRAVGEKFSGNLLRKVGDVRWRANRIFPRNTVCETPGRRAPFHPPQSIRVGGRFEREPVLGSMHSNQNSTDATYAGIGRLFVLEHFPQSGHAAGFQKSCKSSSWAKRSS